MDKRDECAFKERVRRLTKEKHEKKGVCSNCDFKGDTEWHHWEYNVDSVVELCSKCHRNDKCGMKKGMIKKYLDAIRSLL